MSREFIIPVRSIVNIHTERTQGTACKLCVNLSKRSNIFQWKYKKDTLVQLFKSKREALTALNPRRNHRYKALRSSLYVATKPHNTMDDCQQKNQGFGKILINSQLSFITRCSFGIENRDEKVWTDKYFLVIAAQKPRILHTATISLVCGLNIANSQSAAKDGGCQSKVFISVAPVEIQPTIIPPLFYSILVVSRSVYALSKRSLQLFGVYNLQAIRSVH